MALYTVRMQVVIPMDSGIPDDAVSNTWHFEGDDASAGAVATSAAALLTTFYQAIDNQIFPAEVGSPAVVKGYNLADAEPRAPIHESTIALTTGAADGLPHEVAVCLSFEGTRVSGLSQARRRGRIFLGPIRDTGKAVTSSRVEVLDTMQTAIKDAASTLHTAGTSACKWAIFSPTNRAGGASIDASTIAVNNGWVDDAFDTVRSRGEDPKQRATFS